MRPNPLFLLATVADLLVLGYAAQALADEAPAARADETSAPAAAQPAAQDPAFAPAPSPNLMQQLFGDLRLKPAAMWELLGHGLGIPVYFLWMTTLHEGSHALVAEMSGVKVTSFKPYPHFEDFGYGRQFYWGTTNFAGQISKRQETWVLAAPVINDVLLFTASDLTLTYGLDSDSSAAPFFLMGGMICPLVDFLVNVNGPSAGNDTTRWGKNIGMPKWSIMLVGDALAGVAVWRILHHGRNILFEPDSAAGKDHSGVIITPVVSPNILGLAAVGSF